MDSRFDAGGFYGAADPGRGMRLTEPLPPPDLVIQDELHLISGPLGTMVGLYETAVDELCSWNIGETRVRPKVVASTATVRRAGDQVRNVFMRRLAIFPPKALDVEDDFFSVQRPVESKPGRRYIGHSADLRRRMEEHNAGRCPNTAGAEPWKLRVYVGFETLRQAQGFERF